MASSFPDVTSVIPHREPFLFVDRVVDMTDRSIVAVRTFRPDEHFFKGHFPQRPIVPGVLLLEGLAQTLGYFALSHKPSQHAFLVRIDRARFRNIVQPGQEVRYEVEIAGPERFGMLTGRGKVRCNGNRIADADLTGYSGEGPTP
ncbi:MAG: 3-hydroxyacyl-ACP dehydratase FabZ [Myxococcaceae bacterium]